MPYAAPSTATTDRSSVRARQAASAWSEKGLLCSYADAYSWCEGMQGHEATEILAGGRGPCALGDGPEARDHHGIEKPSVVQVFAPKACLHSQQSSLHFLGPVPTGVVGIAALEGNRSCPARPRLPPILGLRHVEIVCLAGRKHDIISLLGQRQSICRSLPRHEIGIAGINAAPERRLLPRAGTTTEVTSHLLDAMQEIRLQPANVVPTVFAHKRSGQRRVEPGVRRHLITADMNPNRGEQTSDFVEHGLQEIVSLTDRRVENVFREAPIAPRLCRISQLRDRLQDAVTVPRDVDLRHDGDEKLLGPARKLRDIRARIDEAVALGRTAKERRDGSAMAAPCSQFGKLRIARYIEPPAFIIAEMKMKTVQLVPSQKIKDP